MRQMIHPPRILATDCVILNTQCWPTLPPRSRSTALVTSYDSVQGLLRGNLTLLGNGQVRDVYLADYDNKTLVIKTLREVPGERRQQFRAKMHIVEATALNAVGVVGIHCMIRSSSYM